MESDSKVTYILYQSWDSGIGIVTRVRALQSGFECRPGKMFSPQHDTVRGADGNMVIDQELNDNFQRIDFMLIPDH